MTGPAESILKKYGAGDLEGAPFSYHGGVAGLEPGQLILLASMLSAPYAGAELHPSTHVHCTLDLYNARWLASTWPNGTVYRVKHIWLKTTHFNEACDYAVILEVIETNVSASYVTQEAISPGIFEESVVNVSGKRARPLTVTTTFPE